MNVNDTIAAISTPTGRGGVALLRVSGDEAVTIAEKVVRKELSTDKGQMELIDRMIDDLS